MRLKPALVVLAALVALALLIRQVTQAVHRTFGGRPGLARLARATPAYQNGLTLMEVDNVSPDRFYDFTEKGQQDRGGSSAGAPAADTGLWVKLPPSVTLPPGSGGSGYPIFQAGLTLTARTSDGREMPLRWRTNGYQNSNGPTYILASIPAGYPDTVRWADVTLEDHHGDSATWRVLDLPPMQHVLAPPVTPQTTFHQGNITVTARAYRGPDPNGSGPMVLCDLTGAITNASNSWELGPFTLTREWEPPGYVAPGGSMTLGTSKDGRNKVTVQATREAVYFNHPDPYLGATRWVRLGARLQEYATYDETVVFHNLSVVRYRGSGGLYLAGAQPQTVTSPSGVTVTLVDVQHEKQLDYSRGGVGVRLLIRYPQTNLYPSLPHSPLWRKHNGVVHVTVEVPKPYEADGYSGSETEGTSGFHSDRPLPKVITNFPIIIRQRVNLLAVPMTFTLPVLEKEPT